MNTNADKLEIIKWIAELDDQSTLQQLKMIKEQSITAQQDWWDTISSEERQSIERGLEDSEEGRTTPHSEVMKRYAKWL